MPKKMHAVLRRSEQKHAFMLENVTRIQDEDGEIRSEELKELEENKEMAHPGRSMDERGARSRI